MSCSKSLVFTYSFLGMTGENQRSSQQVSACGIVKNDNISKNDKYLLIKKALESKEVDREIAFLISITQVFDEFMTKLKEKSHWYTCCI